MSIRVKAMVPSTFLEPKGAVWGIDGHNGLGQWRFHRHWRAGAGQFALANDQLQQDPIPPNHPQAKGYPCQLCQK